MLILNEYSEVKQQDTKRHADKILHNQSINPPSLRTSPSKKKQTRYRKIKAKSTTSSRQCR